MDVVVLVLVDEELPALDVDAPDAAPAEAPLLDDVAPLAPLAA